jgi:hypothetical protein
MQSSSITACMLRPSGRQGAADCLFVRRSLHRRYTARPVVRIVQLLVLGGCIILFQGEGQESAALQCLQLWCRLAGKGSGARTVAPYSTSACHIHVVNGMLTRLMCCQCVLIDCVAAGLVGMFLVCQGSAVVGSASRTKQRACHLLARDTALFCVVCVHLWWHLIGCCVCRAAGTWLGVNFRRPACRDWLFTGYR